jgi:hypothetical protein
MLFLHFQDVILALLSRGAAVLLLQLCCWRCHVASAAVSLALLCCFCTFKMLSWHRQVAGTSVLLVPPFRWCVPLVPPSHWGLQVTWASESLALPSHWHHHAELL